MKYSGVVFDFNGTLFWDTKLHNKAWNIFLNKRNLHLSDDEFFQKIHGKNNKDIFHSILGENLTDAEIYTLAEEKENLYRQLCLEGNMEMAPGVESLLDFLKDRTVPITIATASDKGNVDFYFKYLPLTRWFEYDKITYNNGLIKGKPDPEIYQIAIASINKKPEDVLVFEDANMGLLAAKRANAGGIIAVNSNDDDYSEWSDYQVITNFDQVDRSLFF